MRFRLIVKFILVYLILAVVIFVMIAAFGGRPIENKLIENFSSSLYDEAKSIAAYHVENSVSFVNEESFRYLQTISEYQDRRILIVSSSGNILVDTDWETIPEEKGKIEHFDPANYAKSYYSIGRFYETFQEEMLSVMVPISESYVVSGYVTIHMPMTHIYTLREELLSRLYLLAYSVYAISFVILILLIIWVIRPLNKITGSTRHYSEGDFKYRSRVKSNDELGDLSSMLNYMAEEMEKSTNNQHRFIANVSHDFRSPLTSIKGYIEAIKDGTIPPEDQDKYLDIVLTEANRLTRLTESMLELDRLDFKKAGLDITTFDINATIKETAAAIEGRCRSRNITLSLLLEDDEFFVLGDYGKIQQVLYNLIDNAVKFSNPSSVIEIETTSKYEKAYISVKDHGIGIPNSELNNIWKRFYKVDTSRGKDRTGTGLGLAIVREIIQDHGQKINVISTEKAGSEFVFTLDIPKS